MESGPIDKTVQPHWGVKAYLRERLCTSLCITFSLPLASCLARNFNDNSLSKSSEPDQGDALFEILKPDASRTMLEQLSLWETRANEIERDPANQLNRGLSFVKSEYKVTLPVSLVEVEKVQVTATDVKTKELLDFFKSGAKADHIKWPIHHFAIKNPLIPFFDFNREKNASIEAYDSASRSIFFYTPSASAAKKEAWSIKLPTSVVYTGNTQPNKLDLRFLIKAIPILNKHIAFVDSNVDSWKLFEMIHEVASFSQRKNIGKPNEADENGFIIRDYRPLEKTENWFLPAFSADKLGYKWMQNCKLEGMLPHSKFGVPLITRSLYGSLTARAKAVLLLKYGIILSGPNAQNWLLELNKETFCPTGRIFLRDYSDAMILPDYLRSIGANQFVNDWIEKGGSILQLGDESNSGAMFRVWPDGSKEPLNDAFDPYTTMSTLHLGRGYNHESSDTWIFNAVTIDSIKFILENSIRDRPSQIQELFDALHFSGGKQGTSFLAKGSKQHVFWVLQKLQNAGRQGWLENLKIGMQKLNEQNTFMSWPFNYNDRGYYD